MSPRRRRWRSKAAADTPLGWLAQNHLLVALLAAVAVALSLDTPWVPVSARTVLLQAMVLGFVPLLAASGPYPDDLRTAARRSLHPFLIALLIWCVFSVAIAPYRASAAAELLRLFLCAGIYFAAAYGLRADQLRVAVAVVLLIGAMVAVYGFLQFGSETWQGSGVIISVFKDHQNLGSFLMILLPPALALALGQSGKEKTRVAVQAVTILLGGALLLSRTRSAWIGAVVALFSLCLLSAHHAPIRLNRRSKCLIVSPLVIVAVAFTLLIVMGRIAPLVSKRAGTFARVLDDTSFSDRLHMWRSAARMASERPLTGWGLGVWPVIQSRWTHQGDDVSEVLARGTAYQNLAHNFWVQWAAETGAIGLALHVAVMVAFIFSAVRALPALTSGYRKALLMGCIAATLGACVDAIGSPAYNLPGISVLPWLWMGVGVAACREARPPAPSLPPTPPAVWSGAALMGLAAALVVLGAGYQVRLDGRTKPRGSFVVVAEPSGPMPAGTRVLWTAVYKDALGRPRRTAPGTSWAVTRGRLDGAGPAFVRRFDAPLRSGLQGNLPPDVSSVTVTATYWDDHSRRHDASASVAVEPAEVFGKRATRGGEAEKF